MDQNPLLGIAQGLNAAAAGRADWTVEWARAVAWVGARTSLLAVVDPAGAIDMLAFPVLSETALADYGSHFRNLDPYDRYARPGVATGVIHGEEVIAEADYLESGFYQDFVRTLDQPVMHWLGASPMLVDGTQIRLGLQRERGEFPFDRAEADRLGALLPVLSSAIALRRDVALLRSEIEMRDRILDQGADAVLLVDADGSIDHLNQTAETTCGRYRLIGHDPSRRNRRLAGSPMARKLADAIRAVGSDCPIARLLLEDGHGVALVARLSPFLGVPPGLHREPGPDRAPSRRAGRVLVRLTDMRVRTVDASMLKGLFGMTGAEAEIAPLIARGEQASAIAASRGVSVNTVRTQLRGILCKTNAANLRDLAQLLARL